MAHLTPGGAAVDGSRPAFATRSVEACRVLVALVLAYAISSKFV
jgi:hypothetical protein